LKNIIYGGISLIKETTFNLRETVPEKQNHLEFDPDSSPITWRYFEILYYVFEYKLYSIFQFDFPEYDCYYKDGSHLNLSPLKIKLEPNLKSDICKILDSESEFEKLFEYPDYKNQNQKYFTFELDKQRLYAFEKDTDKSNFGANTHVFRLGGDTDWNFKKVEKKEVNSNKTCSNSNKYQYFKNIIGEGELSKELEKCYKMHHSLLNFSIMPATGNMQKVKFKGYNDEKLDSFDSFISIIDDYYNNKNDILLYGNGKNSPNVEPLKKYLSKFENVYDYAKNHYLIDDKGFIDKLNESGKKPIRDFSDVQRYMKLATEYWDQKESIVKNLSSFESVFRIPDNHTCTVYSVCFKNNK
jgi:hypothetical protein